MEADLLLANAHSDLLDCLKDLQGCQPLFRLGASTCSGNKGRTKGAEERPEEVRQGKARIRGVGAICFLNRRPIRRVFRETKLQDIPCTALLGMGIMGIMGMGMQVA